MNNDTSVHNHRHGTIREQSQEDYFKSAAKRQKLHENAMTQQEQEQLKDFFGPQIDQVDRPNNNILNFTL